MPNLFSRRSLSHLKKNPGFLVFLLLLVILPVLIWVMATGSFELRKKAGSPSTCTPVAQSIFVTPTGPCHDLQAAIDAVTAPNMQINIAAGEYPVAETGQTFSLNIIGKEQLRIVGAEQSSSRAVRLIFEGNRGGILIDESTGSLEWMDIQGRTSNG